MGPMKSGVAQLFIALACAIAGVAHADAPADTPTQGAEAAPTPTRTTVYVDPRAAQLQRDQAAAEGRNEDLTQTEVANDSLAAGGAAPGAQEQPAHAPLSHYHQGGIRVGAGHSALFGVHYKNGPPCARGSDESFCRRLGMPFLDVDISFGVTDSIEIALYGRMGLGRDEVSNERPMQFGFGARAYIPSDFIVKAYFGGLAYVDIQDSTTPKWKMVDVGLRGTIGVQVDVLRYLAFYVQLGVSAQFLNNFYFIGDLSGGLQVRFP